MNSSCQTILVIQRAQKDISKNNHVAPGTFTSLKGDSIVKVEDDFDMKLNRRIHPKSKRDILVLRHELEHWNTKRLSVIEKLEENASCEKIDKRKHQLDAEIKLRRMISGLEQKVYENDVTKTFDRYLQSVINHSRWTLSDGSSVQVETPKSLFMEKVVIIYHSLSSSSSDKFSSSTRISILEDAISICTKVSSQRSKDLFELITREMNFLKRNLKSSLMGLRKRILYQYMNLIKEIHSEY